MESNNLIFAQLKKVDIEKRLVYGRAAQEHPDKADEIFDYATSKPNFQKWSDMAKAATDGASVGNVRAMHGKVAAGKLTELTFNDEEQAIDVCAKVVDENEWNKVLEGVYTGFSIGGSYAKRWADESDAKMTRYTADPSEISLVDRPCIPTATFFEVQKADGVVENVEFKQVAEPVTKAEPATEAIPDVKGSFDEVLAFSKYLNESDISMGDALVLLQKVATREDVSQTEGKEKYGNVKFADSKNKKYPIDNADHIRAAWNYINKDKNAAKYSADDLSTIKASIVSAWKDKIDKEGPPSADKAEVATGLKKNLYTCQSLASIVQNLDYMLSTVEAEEAREGDDTDTTARLNDLVTAAGQLLVDMTAEEVAELTANNKDNSDMSGIPVMQMSLAATNLMKRIPDHVAKAGARNNKTDKGHIQTMHDSSVALGADCSAAKAAPSADLQKAEIDSMLQKALAEATAPLQKALADATETIKKLEAIPAPTKISLRAVAKSDDLHAADLLNKEAKPVVDALGKESEVASLIKMAHKQGGQTINY
jgi:hypothetical protein